MGILVLNTFNSSLDRAIEPLPLSSEAIAFLNEQRINLAAAKIPPELNEELSKAVKDAIALAFVDSFRLVTWIAVGLAIASAILALLFIDRALQKRN